MSNLLFKGIDCRQTGTALVFRCFMQTSTGTKEIVGPVNLTLYELQSDGTLASYDFNSNTFKTTGLTNPTAGMTHQKGNNNTTNTGIWTYSLATLTGFTVGAMYFAQVNDINASPQDQTREFLYGSAEGDLVASAAGTGTAYLKVDLTAIETVSPLSSAGFNLKQLNIVNSTGDALVASSTGNNGNGANFSGNGTADGAKFTGGINGRGIHAFGGATSGAACRFETVSSAQVHAFHCVATSGTGDAMRLDGGTNGLSAFAALAGHGFALNGSNGGHGIASTGGITGNGVTFVGGATNGTGALFQGMLGGHGLRCNVANNGTGSGISASGGTAGGQGMDLISNFPGNPGFRSTGNGSGPGAKFQGGNTGDGADFVGGATSGDGLNSSATNGNGGTFLGGTNGSGVKSTGAGAGDGVTFVAGSTGVDLRANITGSVTGSLSGSVGSVTGNVGGNVVGTVSSVTGNVVGTVASVVGNVGGNVVGTVASVVGNVGGSVLGNLMGSVSGDVDGNLLGSLTAIEHNAIADAYIARNIRGGSSTGRTVAQALAAQRNKVAFDVPGVGQFTVFDVDDITPVYTGVYTASPGASPVTVLDPT